ncbi:Alcohol dehydrogenase superfamily, zinc-type [Niveomyces insectorum RCEF 264]|uniref:enoyl-[acyl-carrier-protein] reductase n=1 Tax=Niveomyces insectorum RCEF 264 TaxID=1081102 RepID=A0A167WCD3_9HYPO|nr:Alcohol dehydrogenase superfamily, zinc-type [Niveomyces insectorum RCEF 264]
MAAVLARPVQRPLRVATASLAPAWRPTANGARVCAAWTATAMATRALAPAATTTFVRRKSGPYGYTQAKALVFSACGEPADVLRLHTHSISPSLPPRAALLRTLAAPINPADVNIVQGTYGSQPTFSSLLGTAEPSSVPGSEGCFEVVAVGAEVADLRPGDWALPAAPGLGTWRTHAVVDDADAALLRRELTALGATVVVTEDEVQARGFAAQRLRTELMGGETERDSPLLLGLNCVGGRSALGVAKCLSEGGRLVTYGAMAKQPVTVPTGLLIFRDLAFQGFWFTRWSAADPAGRRQTVQAVLELMRTGQFQSAPAEEIPWTWDTPVDTLKQAVSGTLEGYRPGKGIFVFKDT